MDDPLWLYLTILRMIVPLLILKRPLLGLFACMAVDYVDFGILPLHTPADYKMYQIWDKVLDTYYLGFAAYIAYSWKDETVARLALGTFAYRVIGVLLLIGYDDHSILLLFPNLFEGLFIFYLLFRSIEKQEKLFNSAEDFIIIFIALFIPKIFQELSLHAHLVLSPIFTSMNATIKIPHYISISFDILPIFFCLSLPLFAFSWRLRKHIVPRASKLRMSIAMAASR